jgi:hypothetical protein
MGLQMFNTTQDQTLRLAGTDAAGESDDVGRRCLIMGLFSSLPLHQVLNVLLGGSNALLRLWCSHLTACMSDRVPEIPALFPEAHQFAGAI